jgi:hypothetical protein
MGKRKKEEKNHRLDSFSHLLWIPGTDCHVVQTPFVTSPLEVIKSGLGIRVLAHCQLSDGVVRITERLSDYL